MLLLGSIRSIMIICIRIDNVFFSKTYPSFLTVKEGSTSLTKPLSCPKREDVTALRCSEPLRYKVGGASKPSPWLCGLGPYGVGVGGDSEGGFSAVLGPGVVVQLVPYYRCNRYHHFILFTIVSRRFRSSYLDGRMVLFCSL